MKTSHTRIFRTNADIIPWAIIAILSALALHSATQSSPPTQPAHVSSPEVLTLPTGPISLEQFRQSPNTDANTK